MDFAEQELIKSETLEVRPAMNFKPDWIDHPGYDALCRGDYGLVCYLNIWSVIQLIIMQFSVDYAIVKVALLLQDWPPVSFNCSNQGTFIFKSTKTTIVILFLCAWRIGWGITPTAKATDVPWRYLQKWNRCSTELSPAGGNNTADHETH